MASLRLWRCLTLALGLLLLVTIALLRIHTGYPAVWNNVQAGMTITQVRILCGSPTYSGGMHPETWEVPFLWGRWVLRVGHSEETQGPEALVSTVDVYFEHVLVDAIVRHHSIRPPVVDYAIYYKAFGQQWKQTVQELPTCGGDAARP